MKKTVAELIEMYKNGKLHLDQSTQRGFVYNDIRINPDSDGEITKAGDVIKTIISRKNVHLPAIYFWNLRGDEHKADFAPDEYNLHDGKQRFSSILYFITADEDVQVTTIYNGAEKRFRQLPNSVKEKLLNYEFDIVVWEGSEAEEEESFMITNDRVEPLTTYEKIHGALHGAFLDGFEKVIEDVARNTDFIHSVQRGEQAIAFLHLCLGTILDEDKNGSRLLKLRSALRRVRNDEFDEVKYDFRHKLQLFSNLCRCVSKGHDQSEAKGCAVKVCQLVEHIILNNYPEDKIIEYYMGLQKHDNDVSSWSLDTHKEALKALCVFHIKCDGKREFDRDDKATLYRLTPKCACEKCTQTSFDKLQVDHIHPWSKGGRTDLNNAQLLCSIHNPSKGNGLQNKKTGGKLL